MRLTLLVQGASFDVKFRAGASFDVRFLRRNQAWGQSTRYFGTLVLEYRFCSTRRYSVLVLLKSTCTRTCTQVLLKIKVLLTSTYEYFTSTSHLKLIQNSSQSNHKSS